MSHLCGHGQLTPINPTPSPDDRPGGVAGTVFLVLFLLVVVLFIGGAAYNYFVLGSRGMAALPLYATCCGVQTARPQYSSDHPTTAGGPGYGSL